MARCTARCGLREVRALKHELNKIVHLSVELLLPLLYRIVGYLLESVLRAAMQPILTSDCVTESAGVDISRVFRTLKRIR